VTQYGSLGDLSDAQLQAALDRFGLGRLAAAEAFTEGLFGKNIGLVTDAGRWVLRGHPWPADSDDQFRKERFWAARIRERCPTVPVPWPFHIEADESLFGWPYQLTPWMPGVQERTAAGAAALGRAAAALRAVTFESFGEWDPDIDDVEPYDGTAAEWLRQRTNRWIDACSRLADIDRDFIDGLLPTDLDHVVPTYIHHDLKIGNCVCRDGEVSGLFDLGEGLVADPIEDLARGLWDLASVDPAHAATYLDEYERAAATTVDTAHLRAYVLIDLLIIWEYGTRPDQRWFDDQPTFEGWATQLAAPALEVLAR
jgi:hygromycin-B 7''-O-kinase